MRVALYARVSTEGQQARGTIGSQLAVLRERVAAAGDELVAEFRDDGHSGARLDRPGLDALRDAAQAGLIEAVWCLSPDRLARVYAYQVIVLDELARHGVAVRFTDAPPLDDDPQARLLTQVQGVIAEYERAKIAERYRRGKLFRSRTGEVLAWRTPYGYRRVPRDASGPARLEVFEPEAAVVRRIFDDYVSGGHSIREIVRRLAADGVPPPTGRRGIWGTSTLGRLLHNEAYIGRVYFNRTEAVPDPRPGQRTRQVPRPREEWIPITVPAIVPQDVFEAVGRVTRDNSGWSPRRTEPGQWMLRGLVKCGACGVGVNCHKMRGRNGTWHRYYHCRNHDPIKAGGPDKRCPERNIRADALDAFVFDQIRTTLLRPDVLLAGEHATACRTPAPDDELLTAELTRLDRKLEAADGERRRLADLYQAGLLDLPETQRRANDVEHRRNDLTRRRDTLTAQRHELARDNQLRRRVGDFAGRVLAVIDTLDFDQKQTLIRLVVEEVRVTGWRVQIRLRIPLDDHPGGPPPGTDPPPNQPPPPPTSTQDRLRSLGGADRDSLRRSAGRRGGRGRVAGSRGRAGGRCGRGRARGRRGRGRNRRGRRRVGERAPSADPMTVERPDPVGDGVPAGGRQRLKRLRHHRTVECGGAGGHGPPARPRHGQEGRVPAHGLAEGQHHPLWRRAERRALLGVAADQARVGERRAGAERHDAESRADHGQARREPTGELAPSRVRRAKQAGPAEQAGREWAQRGVCVRHPATVSHAPRSATFPVAKPALICRHPNQGAAAGRSAHVANRDAEPEQPGDLGEHPLVVEREVAPVRGTDGGQHTDDPFLVRERDGDQGARVDGSDDAAAVREGAEQCRVVRMHLQDRLAGAPRRLGGQVAVPVQTGQQLDQGALAVRPGDPGPAQ
jgi:site-specific DNA recombinase